MPELPEVEAYRQLAVRALGRRITAVDAPDPWYLKGTTAENITVALTGRRFTAARRVGKLLLLDTDRLTLGLRFGMTGRLFVDGVAGVDALRYSKQRGQRRMGSFTCAALRRTWPSRDARPRRPRWCRARPGCRPSRSRRPHHHVDRTYAALHGRAAPLKACLLDQPRVAGIGNLIADEVLWRCGLDPGRPAGSLTPGEVTRLAAPCATPWSC